MHSHPRNLAQRSKFHSRPCMRNLTCPSSASREIDRFVKFLAQHEDTVTTFAELESGHHREYARHLTRQGWATGTVRTYYAYVSAFCGWAVREGHLAENVAQRRNATEPVPNDGGHKSGDQQA